jgi:hypothetical protein
VQRQRSAAITSSTLEQQKAAFAAFDKLSPTFLKPVFDQLIGTLNHVDLKILRMSYLIFRQE